MATDPKKAHRTTTFQISNHLHTQLRLMCTLTQKSMGEFIRIALIDKINQLKAQKPQDPVKKES